MTIKRSTMTVLGLTALVLAFGLVITGCPMMGGGAANPPVDTEPPAKVSALTVNGDATGTEAYLGWTDPADADFDHVEITGTGITGTREVNKGVQVLHITGMSPGASVTYSVISVDTTGNKSEAVTSAAVTLVADTTPPGAITNAQATSHISTEGAITITWDLPGDPDIVKVTIEIDDGAGGGPSSGSSVDLAGDATSYTWTGLTDTATGYIFTINTEDWAANPGTSDSTSATHPLDTTVPYNVTSANAATGGGSNEIYITWTDSVSADVAAVVIEAYTDSGRSIFSGSTSVAVGVQAVTLGTGEFLGAGMPYYIRIFTVDFQGNQSTPDDTAYAFSGT